jgi:hypothetical protein
VKAAVERLREFHQIGCDSLKSRGGHGAYGGKQVEAEAAKLGIDPGHLRKFRQFADPASGYGEDELNELCRLCEEYGRPWGIKHLVIIIRVPKTGGQRSAIQRRAIEGGWTTAQLEAEVRRRFGRRRAGGRKPAVMTDVAGLLSQLEGLCERWSRLHAELTADDRPGPPHPRLRDLPEAIRRKFGDATEAVRQLQSSLNRKLSQHRAPTGRKR